MKTKIIIVALIVSIMLFTGLGSAVNTDNAKMEQLNKFLKSNDVNWNHEEGTLSSTLARRMMIDANNEDMKMGMVKFYNPQAKVGYYFLYYKVNEGQTVFVDPKTDKVYSYGQSINRLSSDVQIKYTRYYCYMPYESFEGFGDLSPDLASKIKTKK
jgi:hypothetical protein